MLLFPCILAVYHGDLADLSGPSGVLVVTFLLVVSTRYHPRDPLLEQGQLIQFGRITHFTQLMGFDFSSFGLGVLRYWLCSCLPLANPLQKSSVYGSLTPLL
jgi:hypothetical protein